MIRRGPASSAVESEPEITPEETPRWRQDLRLFALTWLAGFVFFLVFLA